MRNIQFRPTFAAMSQYLEKLYIYILIGLYSEIYPDAPCIIYPRLTFDEQQG